MMMMMIMAVLPKYCRNVRACLAVHLHVCVSAHVSQEPHVQTSSNFTHVVRGRGALLLWRRRDTLCISGFVNDVIFSHNWLYVKGNAVVEMSRLLPYAL